MKALRFIGALMVALAISACSELNIDRTGTPIRFGAAVERYNPTTRTAYSGSTNVVGEKERIDWVAGDEILIYMYYETRTYHNAQHNAQSGSDKKPYVIIKPITANGHMSDAKVGTYGDPLEWKDDYKETIWNGANEEISWPYKFYFYGIYPAMDVLNLKTDNQSTVSFNLPAVQNGDMSLAYMAATTEKESYTSEAKASDEKDGSVVLQFYPMVTTLWFELKNDTANDIVINTIKVERVNKQDRYNSWQQDLAGAFEAKLENGVFVTSDPHDNSRLSSVQANIDKPVKKSSTISVPVFIRPKTYDTNVIDISVEYTINGDRKLIKNTLGNNKTVSELVACKKYNIGISLNGGGVTVDPPTDPEPPKFDMSDPAAQLIAGALGYGNSGAGLQKEMEEYFKELYPNNFTDFWNKFVNNIRAKLPNVKATDFNIFTEKEWECFKKMFASLTKIEINNGNYVNSKFTAKDFELFPNATALELLCEQDAEIEFNEITTIKDIKITGNGKVVITANNCDLNSISFGSGNLGNGSYAMVDGTRYTNYTKP